MRSDDLVPLLAPGRGAPAGPAVGFRQGLVITWDTETAENTVLVGGTVMENLPILNTSEAAILASGDVVGIMTAGPTWAIMGRFTYPGTPEAVSGIKAITQRIVVSRDGALGTRSSSTWGDLTGVAVGPSVTVKIGDSGRALVFWTCEMGDTPTAVFRAEAGCGPAVSGATTDGPNEDWATGHQLQTGTLGNNTFLRAQYAGMHVYEGLNPGDTTFTLKYRSYTQNAAAASVSVDFTAREIAVFIL